MLAGLPQETKNRLLLKNADDYSYLNQVRKDYYILPCPTAPTPAPLPPYTPAPSYHVHHVQYNNNLLYDIQAVYHNIA
jgi:hypothetical protein